MFALLNVFTHRMVVVVMEFGCTPSRPPSCTTLYQEALEMTPSRGGQTPALMWMMWGWVGWIPLLWPKGNKQLWTTCAKVKEGGSKGGKETGGGAGSCLLRSCLCSAIFKALDLILIISLLFVVIIFIIFRRISMFSSYSFLFLNILFTRWSLEQTGMTNRDCPQTCSSDILSVFSMTIKAEMTTVRPQLLVNLKVVLNVKIIVLIVIICE